MIHKGVPQEHIHILKGRETYNAHGRKWIRNILRKQYRRKDAENMAGHIWRHEGKEKQKQQNAKRRGAANPADRNREKLCLQAIKISIQQTVQINISNNTTKIPHKKERGTQKQYGGIRNARMGGSERSLEMYKTAMEEN